MHSTLKILFRTKTQHKNKRSGRVHQRKKAQWGMTDCVKLKQRHCWNGSPSQCLCLGPWRRRRGISSALHNRPQPAASHSQNYDSACSVTLSLIFCTAPIRPQRKRDPPPRSFALLNYCEKRANNAAAHVQLRQIYRPFLHVAAIINSVISVALFAGM